MGGPESSIFAGSFRPIAACECGRDLHRSQHHHRASIWSPRDGRGSRETASSCPRANSPAIFSLAKSAVAGRGGSHRASPGWPGAGRGLDRPTSTIRRGSFRSAGSVTPAAIASISIHSCSRPTTEASWFVSTRSRDWGCIHSICPGRRSIFWRPMVTSGCWPPRDAGVAMIRREHVERSPMRKRGMGQRQKLPRLRITVARVAGRRRTI